MSTLLKEDRSKFTLIIYLLDLYTEYIIIDRYYINIYNNTKYVLYINIYNNTIFVLIDNGYIDNIL